MFGKKGQEEAPFAIFLAAVMLALLIPIVASLYGKFDEVRCQEQLHNNMETLAREIEIATGLTGNGTIVRVDFSSFSCGSIQVSNITIRNFGHTECIQSCQVGTCRMIIAQGEKNGQLTTVGEPVCVRIPPEIILKVTDCSDFGPNYKSLYGVYNTVPYHSFRARPYNLVFLKKIEGGQNTLYICCVDEPPGVCV